MRWANAVGWTVALCVWAAAAEKAMSQSTPVGLGPSARPTFGNRPVGLGFRPEASGGRPTLRHATGLQDAMSAARANPLEPPPIFVAPPDPELMQAIQALRNQQQLQSQQLAAQATARRSAASVAPHVVRANLPAPPRAPASDVQDRLRGYLKNLGKLSEGIAVSQKGTVYLLQGTTASEDERRVVEQLLRLEPGVYQVENQLKIASPAAKHRP